MPDNSPRQTRYDQQQDSNPNRYSKRGDVVATTLPNGQRLRQSAGTENWEDAEALLAKLTLDSYRAAHFGFKPERSWQEAVVRYLAVKSMLRSYGDVKRICRMLDPKRILKSSTSRTCLRNS